MVLVTPRVSWMFNTEVSIATYPAEPSAPLLAAMASLEVVHPRMRSRSALVFTASDVNPGRAAGLIVCEKGTS